MLRLPAELCPAGEPVSGFGVALRSFRRPRHQSRSYASRMLAIEYIESHLYDPELTPTTAALACGMTPRYLHLLFAAQGETAARYILRRRLEDCARALGAPTHPDRTITAIAFDHGFNSPTHFGRAFRARFGMTPRRYRDRRRQPEATLPG